jgi:hypothetical protein
LSLGAELVENMKTVRLLTGLHAAEKLYLPGGQDLRNLLEILGSRLRR